MRLALLMLAFRQRCRALQQLTFIAMFCACGTIPEVVYTEGGPDVDAEVRRVIAAVNAEAGGERLRHGYGVHVDISRSIECGYYDYARSTAFVNPACLRFGPDALETIIVHELGHAFGLMHSDNKESIMHENMLTDRRLDEAAKSLVTELYYARKRLHGP